MSEPLLREILVRLTGIESRLTGIESRLDGIESRLDGIESRLDAVESRLDAVESRLDAVESRLDAVEQRQDDAAEEIRGLVIYMDRRFARVESGVARNGTAIEQVNDRLRAVADGVGSNAERLGRFERETRDRFDRMENGFLAWQGLAEERLHRLESA
jgi:chromosome segregation ATPase